jgi:O-antigen biosynthesis protein
MHELFKRPRPLKPLEWTGERLTTGTTGQVEVEHLHRYFIARQMVRGLEVLDIASGEGYGSALLAQTAKSVVGVELDQRAVDHARAGYIAQNLRFEQGSAQSIPLPDQSFDCVVSFETIEHFYEQEQFLSEVRRVLRPGGKLLISSPNRDVYSPPGRPPNPYHVRELTRLEFESVLKSYFENVAILTQRPMVGSVVAREIGVEGPCQSLTIEHRGDDYFEASEAFDRPMYFIAIASNAALSPLGDSFFFERASVDDIMITLPALRVEHQRLKENFQRLEYESDLAKRNADALAASLRQYEETLGQRDRLIAEKDEKDGRSIETRLECQRLSADLREGWDALERKEHEIQQAARSLAQKDQEIQQASKSLAEKDLQIEQATTVIAHISARFATLTDSLARPRWPSRLIFPKRRRELPAEVCAESIDTIRRSVFFDPKFYLDANPDVNAAGADPALHYLQFGASEGRDPGPLFSTKKYRQRNPDVDAENQNALVHYEQNELSGRRLGPRPAWSPKVKGPATIKGTTDVFSYTSNNSPPPYQFCNMTA